MPELPEVETIRLFLQPLLKGKRIIAVDVFEKKQFIGNKDAIVGLKVDDVLRYGKVLEIYLSHSLILYVHLRMSGQLLYLNNKPSRLPKHTRIIMTFSDQSILLFDDTRKFGWFRVEDSIKNQAFLPLGIEPFDPTFTSDYLKKIFSKSAKPIKVFLLDQTKIAGLGNIYANEALFKAGIRPTRKTNSLTFNEIEDLKKAIIGVLKDGIFHGGSSAKDGKYIRPDGSLGNYQHHFLVYQKEKTPCINSCGSIIVRMNLGGRGTFYCPLCQK